METSLKNLKEKAAAHLESVEVSLQFGLLV